MAGPIYAACVALSVASSVLAAPTIAAPPIVRHCGCSTPAIGLGYDLEATHANVAAYFPNGTVADLGTIPAPTDFTSFYHGTYEPQVIKACSANSGPLSLRQIWEGIRTFVVLHGSRPLCEKRPDLAPMTDFLVAITNYASDKLYETSDPIAALPKNIILTSADLGRLELDEESMMARHGDRIGGITWSALIEKDEAVFRASIGATLEVSSGVEEDNVAEGYKDEAAKEVDVERPMGLVLSVHFDRDALIVNTATYDATSHALLASHGHNSEAAAPELTGGHCERVRQVAEVIQARITPALPCMSRVEDIKRLVVTGELSTEEGVLDGIEVALGMAGVETSLMDDVRTAQESGITVGSFVAARGAAGLGARSGMCGMVVVLEEISTEGDEDAADVESDTMLVGVGLGPVVVAEISPDGDAQPQEQSSDEDLAIQVEWETLEDNVEIRPNGEAPSSAGEDQTEDADRLGHEDELKV